MRHRWNPSSPGGPTQVWVVPITGRVPDPASFSGTEQREAAERALVYMGLEPNTPMQEIKIDRVFLGSCTNARIEDLRNAAAVAKGRMVNPDVYAMVVPGSNAIKLQAEEEGLDRIFRDAGFDWREAGCSMCLGMNPDILEPGQRCASTIQPQLRGAPGQGRPHPPGEPSDGRRRRHRGPLRGHPGVVDQQGQVRNEKARDTMTQHKLKFTVNDYMTAPPDKRYQLLDGEMILVPSPTNRHQATLGELFTAVSQFVSRNGLGQVRFAPLDVVLSSYDVVQPDLLYVSSERSGIITDANIQGAPDLVVEILSPGTAVYDRGYKRTLYGRSGVREYWLVDLEASTVEVLTARDQELVTGTTYGRGDTMTSPVLPGLAIELQQIFG